MKRFRRLVPREFWLAMLTLLGVIVLDVLPALIIGVVIALLLLVYQASRPRVSTLGADPVVPGAFADIGRHDGIAPVPGVLIVRPDAPPVLRQRRTGARCHRAGGGERPGRGARPGRQRQ